MRFFPPLFALAPLVLACGSAPAPDEPPPSARELRVGFLIVDGVYNTELTAPFDVFQHTVFHVQPGMQVFTVAQSLEPVRTFEGLRILPDYTLEGAPPIDVLVVPSAEHSMDTDLENAALMAWVRNVGMRAQYVLSLCDGAFVLAKAGLLDGKTATTFPADIGRLRELFGSTVDVRADVSFVHDAARITSAGGAQSFDAALYLCELLYGTEVARRIGRGLVIDWDLDEVRCVIER